MKWSVPNRLRGSTLRTDLKQRIILGINHHLLYAEAASCAEAHLKTVSEAISLPGFEMIEMRVWTEEEIARQEIDIVAQSRRATIYSMPFLGADPRSNPSGADAQGRQRALYQAARHMEWASRLGAKKFSILSGYDSKDREEAKKCFVDFLQKLCDIAGGYGMTAVIEPFDRWEHGRNLLVGPTDFAVEVVEMVHAAGEKNLGLLIDMGHIPLQEETFEHALRVAGRHVLHVHLGNCVKSNPHNPFFGDKHPPFGCPDGENDIAELATFLELLSEVGYLGGNERPTITVEMRPWPGDSPGKTAEVAVSKIEEAWKMVLDRVVDK